MVDRVIQQHIHVHDGCKAVTCIVPLKHLTKMPHVRVFLEGLVNVAVDKDLTGEDFRVLLVCLSEMEFENFLNKTQSELAEILGIKQQAIARSLKKLMTKGYIKIVGHRGRQNIYQINPNVAFKSRAKNLDVMLDAWESSLGIIPERLE